jgi:galactokinase
MRLEALRLFRDTFGMAPKAMASAPGRVNLIGEHTDYNGGPVLPIAVAARTTVAVGTGEAGMLELVSAHAPTSGVERIAWNSALPRHWGAYVAGVMRELWAAEIIPENGGARIAVASDVPIGAGLSSSAALTVASARALTTLAAGTLTPRKIAGIAFRAEHDHVGVRCGIMDQTISAMAKAGHALLLECASLASRHIPVRGRLLLVDTGGRRELATVEYSRRRAECEAAVTRLKVELPELIWLASWPAKWLARLKKALPEPLRSRAVHVVSETARVRFAAQLLERGRLRDFGRLLYESHDSLRRYYECSTPELDLVVTAAQKAGALGARLTGAGWGGAVVVLLKDGTRRTKRTDDGEASRVSEAIHRAFRRKFCHDPAIGPIVPSGGVRLERV